MDKVTKKSLAHYDLVLFDFGNTLADEFYFGYRPDYFPQFPDVVRKELHDIYYADPSGENKLNHWMDGKISKYEIAEYLAGRCASTPKVILEAMAESCRRVTVFDQAMNLAVATSSRTKTAIVTINADIFSEFIVPSLMLDQKFHGIFNSCKFRTRSKLELCKFALRDMGNVPIANSILIDNTALNCQEFMNAGGDAYVFKTEDEFVSRFGELLRLG